MKSPFLDCGGKHSATPLCPAFSTELPLVFTRDRSRNRMSEAHVPRKTENYGRLGETPLFRRPAADTPPYKLFGSENAMISLAAR